MDQRYPDIYGSEPSGWSVEGRGAVAARTHLPARAHGTCLRFRHVASLLFIALLRMTRA